MGSAGGRQPAGSIQSVGKENIIDQDSYEMVKRPRRLGQCMPEIFAVDAEESGNCITKELLKARMENLIKNTMNI